MHHSLFHWCFTMSFILRADLNGILAQINNLDALVTFQSSSYLNEMSEYNYVEKKFKIFVEGGATALGGFKRALVLLELESQVTVSHPM